MVHDQLHIRGGPSGCRGSSTAFPFQTPTSPRTSGGAIRSAKTIDVVEIQAWRANPARIRRIGLYGPQFQRHSQVRFSKPRTAKPRLSPPTAGHQFDGQPAQFSAITPKRFRVVRQRQRQRASDIGLIAARNRRNFTTTITVSASLLRSFSMPHRENQLRFRRLRARRPIFQIPNTFNQQQIGMRDVETRRRDVFGNFSWVHTLNSGVLFTVAPFFHWNRAAYDGLSPVFRRDTRWSSHHDRSQRFALTKEASPLWRFTRGRAQRPLRLLRLRRKRDDSFFRCRQTPTAVPRPPPQSSETTRLAIQHVMPEDQLRLTEMAYVSNGGFPLHPFFRAEIVEDKPIRPRSARLCRIPKLNWVARRHLQPFFFKRSPPHDDFRPVCSIPPALVFFHCAGGKPDEQREFRPCRFPIRELDASISPIFQTHAP